MGRKKAKISLPDKEGDVGVDKPAPPLAESTPKLRSQSNPPVDLSPAMAATAESTHSYENDPRPTKRQKTGGDGGSISTAPSHIDCSDELETHNAGQDETTAWATTYRLPSEFEHLQARFNFTTMSILSSSKIEQKVRNLISRTQIPGTVDDGTKPDVVVLCAKGGSIAKLVSVVEIAKRAIAAEGGKWFEYISLNGEITNMKDRKPKKKEGGKTLREWEKENSTGGKASGEGQRDVIGSEDPLRVTYKDDEEAAFQTMGRQEIMAYDKNPKKIRMLPQMTTYIARVPIPGLKAFFGSVDSIKPPDLWHFQD
ncbi:MAG: hypothetical protein HETSPECPRED_004365 [Heterodermia speciosa]|uniref:DNA/RNA-binding protein Alba-like domain-containing protein n=1 Tax=Heterodermia speciosa TaxID=116794 RepID=A0A8H3F8U2_9LECA|nr:MAG: hypothetical protein HETSPECPRED_004365 [Heterodermia speciosa]